MKRSRFLVALMLAAVWTNAFAVTNLQLPAEVFEVNGRSAFVMHAENPAPGRPWVWYAPTLQNLPDRSHHFYFNPLLERGVAIAGYDLGEVRGAPGSSQQFTEFYEAIVAKGYSTKPVLLGQSRGGLMMLCWAFRNPDKVQAVAGIYPVCNLTSWPMKYTKTAVLADYGLSEESFLKQLDAFNPPANMERLAKSGVPIFMVHGDSDKVVPLGENSALIKAAYEKAGGDIEVMVVPGKGHEVVPEFFKNPALLEFLLKQTKENKR